MLDKRGNRPAHAMRWEKVTARAEVRRCRLSWPSLLYALLIGTTLVFSMASVAMPYSGASWNEDSLKFCKHVSGPDTVCTFTEESWENMIHMFAREEVTDIYVKDIVPAEFEVEVISYTHGTVEVTPLGHGEMGATKVEWWIDELARHEQAMLVFDVTTRLNPSGRQEFTSPGTYPVNTGYTIHWVSGGIRYQSDTGGREWVVEAIDCRRK